MTNKELYTRCLELSGMIKKYRNQFIALLPEVNKRELYREHGMHSIYEFAAKLAGLQHDTVRRVLKLNENLKNKPVLTSMFNAGEIGWSKLEVAVKLNTSEQELARILPTITQASLEVMAKDIRTKNVDNVNVEVEKFSANLDPKLISRLKVLQLKLEKRTGKPLTWNETLKEMVNIVEETIAPKERKTIPNESKSRYVSQYQKRQALNKTNQLCAKCNKPAEHLHHQSPYSISKSHESIIPLCKAHHDIEHHKDNTYINRKYQLHKRMATRL